jgi:hypothetical protein
MQNSYSDYILIYLKISGMAEKNAPRWSSSAAPIYTFMSCKGTALRLFVQRRTLIQYMLISDQKVIRRFCLCRIQKQQGRWCVYDETWRCVRKIFVPPQLSQKSGTVSLEDSALAFQCLQHQQNVQKGSRKMTDIFPDCNQISIFTTHFHESFRYQTSWKSGQ